MQCATLLPATPLLSHPATVAIGTFDGLHLGHQALLRAMPVSQPRVVISFDPNPSQILTPAQPKRLICSVAQRLNLLEQMGIDWTYLIPFSQQLAAQTAEEFLTRLHSSVPLTQLFVGPTAQLGCDRLDPRQIAKLAERLGFELTVVEAVTLQDQPISSRRIREHLEQGDLDLASECLGRPYAVRGRIVSGHRLGRQFGYPTANLRVEALALPPCGIYAAECLHQGRSYIAMAYLGGAPTVYKDRELLLETNLLEACPGLATGDDIEVTLRAFLRADAQFPSITALVTQMDQDRANALAWFEKTDRTNTYVSKIHN